MYRRSCCTSESAVAAASPQTAHLCNLRRVTPQRQNRAQVPSKAQKNLYISRQRRPKSKGRLGSPKEHTLRTPLGCGCGCGCDVTSSWHYYLITYKSSARKYQLIKPSRKCARFNCNDDLCSGGFNERIFSVRTISSDRVKLAKVGVQLPKDGCNTIIDSPNIDATEFLMENTALIACESEVPRNSVENDTQSEQIRLQSTIPSTSVNINTNKPETPTELLELNRTITHNNNNNNILTAVALSEKSSATNSARSTPPASSPILNGTHNVRKIASVNLLDKKTQSKLQSVRGNKIVLTKQQQQQQEQQQQTHSVDDTANTHPTPQDLDPLDLKQLKFLNRHSCNGRLDYAALEQHLQQQEVVKEQQNKGVEALGILLQYMAFSLNAFACPELQRENKKAKDNLKETLQLLDEARLSCTELQEQLCDKEAYFTQREEELQAMHRCELEKVQVDLLEVQTYAQRQVRELRANLTEKDAQHNRTIECYRLEMENKMAQKAQKLDTATEQINKMQEQLKVYECSELALRDKLTIAENACAERRQAAALREEEFNERIKLLTKELNTLRASKEDRERELRDQLNLSHDEIAVLRTSQRSLNESIDIRMMPSPRNSSSSSVNTSTEITRLQSEAESLRCVLELKQKDISKLNKQNEELLRDADERTTLLSKISLLESRNELLQTELTIKSEKEMEFQREIDEAKKKFNHENVKCQRLSCDNEQLQYILKQRSEQLHIVESKLQELSSCSFESFNTFNLNTTFGFNNRNAMLNGSCTSTTNNTDVSPPASPVIKGVIEKNDSVSWVLEIDDETPEAAASKMVKRAGSLRSCTERTPTQRRQLSVSASAGNANSSLNSNGPNPLSQSMSAHAVVRQHSNETNVDSSANRSHSRLRSQSVCVKNGDSSNTKSSKKLARQHSGGSSNGSNNANGRKSDFVLPTWKEPITSSSPYSTVNMRPRTSTVKQKASPAASPPTVSVAQSMQEELFRRSSAVSKLITCDTSTLNSGERLNMHALPAHSSVQDFKVLKKFQEIQESAGEAMVSGTNSEDESCSASSDDIGSSTSSATSEQTSDSHSISKPNNNSHMSFEEAMLLEKMNSLTGTPMEVSWSEDADNFANGATA